MHRVAKLDTSSFEKLETKSDSTTPDGSQDDQLSVVVAQLSEMNKSFKKMMEDNVKNYRQNRGSGKSKQNNNSGQQGNGNSRKRKTNKSNSGAMAPPIKVKKLIGYNGVKKQYQAKLQIRPSDDASWNETIGSLDSGTLKTVGGFQAHTKYCDEVKPLSLIHI